MRPVDLELIEVNGAGRPIMVCRHRFIQPWHVNMIGVEGQIDGECVVDISRHCLDPFDFHPENFLDLRRLGGLLIRRLNALEWRFRVKLQGFANMVFLNALRVCRFDFHFTFLGPPNSHLQSQTQLSTATTTYFQRFWKFNCWIL